MVTIMAKAVKGAAVANGSVSRSICDKPRKKIFCGPDKYLRLVTHTITERTFPILEDDSFFLCRKGLRQVYA